MAKHCPANERMKRDYLIYLQEAQRYSEASIDAVAKAIARFEQYTGHRDFKKFHIQQAVGFKKYLAAQTSVSTGKALSLGTQRSTLNALRSLFIWLAAQPGYKSRVSYADADYFNLSEKDNRAAQSRAPCQFPSVAQVQHVVRTLSASTPLEQRDRALVAFALMTACRDGAMVSLKLKNLDLENSLVHLDAREVNTKNSKTFTTFFMPVGDDIRAILEDWIETLIREHQWGPHDPLFPATLVEHDREHGFRAAGIKREHWTTTNSVRRIFREAFERAGLPYFHPHSFRHTLAHLGLQICTTPEAVKAWSQNLGHEHVMTTFNSYGNVALDRQAEIIQGLGNPAQRELADLLRQAVSVAERQQTPRQ